MTLQFVKCKPAFDKQQLQKVEKLIGQPLPKEYLLHMNQYNGGRPVPDAFYYQSDDGQKHMNMVAWFFNIGDAPYENLLEYIEDYEGRIPANFMPFARDPGGGLLCLGYKGKLEGKVALWLRELEVADGELPDYSNMAYVADSFTAFLNGLFSPT